jgi:pre-mRNA cleavage complex 2 protein Pcf11
MSYGQSPDDVADDFTAALQDLSINSRYEISNLTIIAKENTEHAFAIAEALKNHIKQVGQASLCALLECLVYLSFPFQCCASLWSECFDSITYTSSDLPTEKATCFLCSRFRRQECRHSIHSLLWPAALLDLHGGICFSRY